MSALITGQLPNKPRIYWYNCLHKMSSLITGQLPNEPNIHSVKILTYNVCINYWPITKRNQNTLSKTANNKCPH